MTTAVYPVFASGLIDTIANAMGAEPVEEWPADALEQGAAFCRQARGLVKGIREELEQVLRKGKEAKALVAEIEPAAQALGKALASLSSRLDENGGRPSNPKAESFLSECEALVREAADFQSTLTEVLARAAAPLPPIDWNRVKEAEEAFVRGETRPFQRTPKA
jgi:hypothetical protein